MTLEVVEAVIQVGAVETAYWRAGRGTPVLLLAGADPGSLLLLLAPFFRVIAPAGPADDPAGSWLQGILDGLGLDRPAMVAEPRYGAFLAAFAASDPDRIGRVVLLPHDPAPPAGELVPWLVERLVEDRERDD